MNKTKAVLLVEDNQDNADLICDLIGGIYSVVCFADGASALNALNGHGVEPPQLFLLDISLPGMDGATLLGKLRSDERLRNIPAIALTAHAMKAEREEFMAAGFDAYLSKPITDDQLLLETIEAQLGRKAR